ncbi:BlaI/MecI/CopY family transcriptional regulator [Tenacibaculum sp. 190524A02b]|uniref:BlaI/MecI/CopY family transcriptional regulator n=1 Tax=Tenacibaculum vairaonense TaxID=3137860 RepID=UPI0032B17D78
MTIIIVIVVKKLYICPMNELTKAEEQVMQYVWKLEKAFLKDIVEQFPEPKPAYTTISTVVRVLVKKEFLKYDTYGKIRQYSATISKDNYFKRHMKEVIKNFFSGSPSKFALFFTNNEDLNLTELENMKLMLESKIEKLKATNE